MRRTLRHAGFQTGIVLPEDGEIHPAKFVQHVIQQAHQSGVQVYTHSPVSQIDSSDGVHLRHHRAVLRHTWQYSAQMLIYPNPIIRRSYTLFEDRCCVRHLNTIFELADLCRPWL